ncbi:MAG: PHB/PHA accumulation regulator DNA-binding domain protein [Acidobacteria bacterium ADurb.Bin051]|jgi:polyhydroxyalkanoate synthesis repressor PhaR|nr:MAG: PHB/PHA accumulation regulator DNA-binding domain protein [Acidobacteria bacterium ADurb.Bin051]
MVRLIKRYESRKLYDTEESRYVSLEEVAEWVRAGQEVRVIDNASSGDVTAQTLTQIILDEGRKGTVALPADLLHDLVRFGRRAVNTGVEQVQSGMDRLLQRSLDTFGPVRRARDEMDRLRARLEQLESSLAELEVNHDTVLAGSVVAGAEASPTRTVRRKQGEEE